MMRGAPCLLIVLALAGCAKKSVVEQSTFVKDSKAEELLDAAGRGRIDEVSALVKSTQVNYTSSGGWTALMMATRNRQHEVMKLLLKAGADPDLTNSATRFTPLHLAAFNDDVVALRLLLNAGAHPDRKSRNDSLTPLGVAREMNKAAAVKILKDYRSR